MLGQPAKPPVMVPRFIIRGYINIKRMAIMLVLMYVIFVIWVICFWVIVIPQMEESNEDIQIMGNFMKGSPFHLIRLAYQLTLIIFGPLDFILAFMMWRATPPLRNVRILQPLFMIYIFHRILIILLVTILSSIVVIANDFGYLLDIHYFSIVIFLIICIMIIVIINKKVLGRNTGGLHINPSRLPR